MSSKTEKRDLYFKCQDIPSEVRHISTRQKPKKRRLKNMKSL